ncbi:hypothetical protein EV361DRAFT_516036 [Lentinula raphanica]|nr:hypothetical protein EV361DRAFT_516036 [Lentinula raphanica]
MTLCELATAKHYAPPMECDVFSARLHEPSYRSGFSARQQEEFEDSRGECVNALSRSAQFWSSYSGYLREIPQLCFTFQKGNDIDHAKKIFQNISLNQDLFLRMVVDREHMNQKHTERLSAFLDDAHGVTDQLSFLAQRIQTEASSAVKEFEKHGSEILELLSRSMSDFWLQMHDNHSVQVTNINSALTGLSKRHSEDLQAIVPELRGVLLQLLTQSHEIARKQEEIILRELTNSVQDQWRVLYSEFSVMHEAITHLTALTTSNALSISSQFDQTAQNIDQAQALISNSTTQLSDVLDRLAEKTNQQMEVLDVKVEELKEKLIPPSPDENQSWFSYESVTSERWWKSKLVSALGFWIRGVPLSAWANSPFLKILEIIWVITFWLLQRSLSTVTSFVILCFSCRKYVHRAFVASISHRAPYDPESRGEEGKVLFQSTNSIDSALFMDQGPYHHHPQGSLSIAPENVITPESRDPQARITICRIRLPSSSVSARSAARPSSRFTSRIPDRLYMPNGLP